MFYRALPLKIFLGANPQIPFSTECLSNRTIVANAFLPIDADM